MAKDLRSASDTAEGREGLLARTTIAGRPALLHGLGSQSCPLDEFVMQQTMTMVSGRFAALFPRYVIRCLLPDLTRMYGPAAFRKRVRLG